MRAPLEEVLYRAGNWTRGAVEREGGPSAKTLKRVLAGGVPRRSTVKRIAQTIGVPERTLWRAIFATHDELGDRREKETSW
jgi:lambda repressor-like predicted transcriptional regulator